MSCSATHSGYPLINEYDLSMELKEKKRKKEGRRGGKTHWEQKKEFSCAPGERPLFSVHTEAALSGFPLVLPDRAGALLYMTVSHAFMGRFDTTALLFNARSSLSPLSAAIWCGGDRRTKTDRESKGLKEGGKKENQETADETDLCPVLKRQGGKVGLQRERVKGDTEAV